jgi:hypothetical protein
MVRFRRGATYFLVGLALLGASGCATTGYTGGKRVNYEFCDKYGEYKLVKKNNDLYIEKLDGSESRRITNTPNIREGTARFISEGKYIIYSEVPKIGWGITGSYIIPRNSNDKDRKEISRDEFFALEELEQIKN